MRILIKLLTAVAPVRQLQALETFLGVFEQ
jgi:hypothetical protein